MVRSRNGEGQTQEEWRHLEFFGANRSREGIHTGCWPPRPTRKPCSLHAYIEVYCIVRELSRAAPSVKNHNPKPEKQEDDRKQRQPEKQPANCLGLFKLSREQVFDSLRLGLGLLINGRRNHARERKDHDRDTQPHCVTFEKVHRFFPPIGGPFRRCGGDSLRPRPKSRAGLLHWGSNHAGLLHFEFCGYLGVLRLQIKNGSILRTWGQLDTPLIHFAKTFGLLFKPSDNARK